MNKKQAQERLFKIYDNRGEDWVRARLANQIGSPQEKERRMLNLWLAKQKRRALVMPILLLVFTVIAATAAVIAATPVLVDWFGVSPQ